LAAHRLQTGFLSSHLIFLFRHVKHPCLDLCLAVDAADVDATGSSGMFDPDE
jgi:hypothetical protein